MFVKLNTPDDKAVYVNRDRVSIVTIGEDFHNYENPDDYDKYIDGGVMRTVVLIDGEEFFVKETPAEVADLLTVGK